MDGCHLGEFFLEFEQAGELLDLLVHGKDFAGVALPVGFLLLALGHFLLAVLGAQSSLGALLAEVLEAGGVKPLASQKGTEFSQLGAGVGFFENAELVRSGKATPGRFVDHLGIRDATPALERGRREGRRFGLAVGVNLFDNQCVHGKFAFSALLDSTLFCVQDFLSAYCGTQG